MLFRSGLRGWRFAKTYEEQMSDNGNSKRLGFLEDRLYVLENVVAGLARKAGAPPHYIDRWRKFINDWPDHKSDATLANEAQFLIDWAEDLR
jgi:hypothetical protein